MKVSVKIKSLTQVTLALGGFVKTGIFFWLLDEHQEESIEVGT